MFELPVAEAGEWLDATYGIVSAEAEAEAEAEALGWDAFLGGLLDDRERPDD
ncbi:hypothetical protein [Streptomyces sp. Ncost-T10-10d]|uniref:hypothetical protein n=1 Tax=Streptomyces sp. Ncost-T10-10d TaxID=1839774 RepID=UPI00081E5BC4|nr:hypothetical protein [Streptomyces sp. Ncost-T10-10d]SCF65432.1 hypothetical protein GA0115254_109616 [Streptomyces sp. Ncost-T10-10d]